jgi:hypothetical protein
LCLISVLTIKDSFSNSNPTQAFMKGNCNIEDKKPGIFPPL